MVEEKSEKVIKTPVTPIVPEGVPATPQVSQEKKSLSGKLTARIEDQWLKVLKTGEKITSDVRGLARRMAEDGKIVPQMGAATEEQYSDVLRSVSQSKKEGVSNWISEWQRVVREGTPEEKREHLGILSRMIAETSEEEIAPFLRIKSMADAEYSGRVKPGREHPERPLLEFSFLNSNRFSQDEKNAKGMALAREISELRGKAQTKEDYLLVQQKLKELENLFKPVKGWNIEGGLNEREHLIAKVRNVGLVHDAKFSPDGSKVIIGSGSEMNSKKVRGYGCVISLGKLGDKEKPTIEREFGDDLGQITTVDFNPKNDIFACGDSVGNVRVYFTNSQDKDMRAFKLDVPEGYFIRHVKFNPDGDRIVVSSRLENKDNIKMFSWPSGNLLAQDNIHADAVKFSSDGKEAILLQTYRSEEILSLLSTSSGELKQKMLSRLSRRKFIWVTYQGSDFDLEGGKIIVGGEPEDQKGKGAVTVISFNNNNVNSGILVQELVADLTYESRVYCTALSLCGKKAVIGCEDGTVLILSLVDFDHRGKPKILSYFKADACVTAVRFDREEKKLLVASYDGVVRVFGRRE